MRIRKRELFAEVGYTPHEGQALVHRSKKRRRVMACGTRFGKSKCASMEAIAALLEPRRDTLGWIVAPTYDLAARIMRQVVIVVETKLRHRIQEIDARQQRIVITNLAGGRSELRVKSADQPVGLLGEALDFLIVDEAAKLRREIWEEYLSPRLLDRNGWSLLISTPEGGGWFHEQYKRGQRGRDPECESWALPTRDNPHIDPELIEAERSRLTPDLFAQQYEAKFIGVESEPCETCGGPRMDAPGDIEMLDGDEPKDCSECGLPVGEDGRCLMSGSLSGGAHLGISYMLPSGEFADHATEMWLPAKSRYMKVIRCDPGSEQ